MKAIILAGGQSRRFGSPKAFAQVNGQTFYKKLIDMLEATNLFEDIIVSTNKDIDHKFEGIPRVVDLKEHEDKGPLAGIYSVMKQYKPSNDLFFVISVDTPLVTQKAVSRLYQFMIDNLIEEQLDVAGYMSEGYPIPTIAFYHQRTLPVIEDALNSDDFSMKHVYQQVSADWLDVSEITQPPNWYQNVNYQSDLDKIENEV